MNDQPHNKELEDLLKNLKTKKAGSLDDFEREAMDGFESLGSEQEALDAKATLDKRIYREVFTEKKDNHKVYWFAAAGLFMVIGLSIYFILSQQVIKEKDVALVPQNTVKNLEKEKTATPVPEETAPVDTREKKTGNNQERPAGGKKQEQKQEGVSSRAVLKPAQNTQPASPGIVSADKSEDLDKGAKAAGETGKQLSKDANLDDLKLKKAEEQNKEAENAKGALADNVTLSETKTSDREELKKNSRNNRSTHKRKEAASKAAAEEDESKQPAEKSGVNTVASTSGASVKQNDNIPVAGGNSTPKGTVTDQKAGAPAYNEPAKKADEYNSPDNTCYYAGGLDDLKNDIEGKLKEKGANKKFDAILHINEKKQVEKVNFLNVYDLTTEEKTKVTEALKTLSKFNFYIQPVKKSLFEFKLLYRP